MRAYLFALFLVPVLIRPAHADGCCQGGLAQWLLASMCGPWCDAPDDEHARIVKEVVEEANRLVVTAQKLERSLAPALQFSGSRPAPTGGTRLSGDGVFDLALATITSQSPSYQPPRPVHVVPISLRADRTATLVRRHYEGRDIEKGIGSRIIRSYWGTCSEPVSEDSIALTQEDGADYSFPLLKSPLAVESPALRAGCERIDKTNDANVVILRGGVDLYNETLGTRLFLRFDVVLVNLQTGAVQILDKPHEEPEPGHLPEMDWRFLKAPREPKPFVWRLGFAR